MTNSHLNFCFGGHGTHGYTSKNTASEFAKVSKTPGLQITVRWVNDDNFLILIK